MYCLTLFGKPCHKSTLLSVWGFEFGIPNQYTGFKILFMWKPCAQNNHAPLKKKFITGNQAPFMTRNLRKEIYTRSRLRNKFCKNPTKENEKLYKKQRNKCVALKRKFIKEYFHNISNKNTVTNNQRVLIRYLLS